MSRAIVDAGAVSCTATLLDADGVRALDAAGWDRLCADALVENPYYARQYVMAGLDALPGERDLRAVAVHMRGQGRLVGLFPFRKARLGPLAVPGYAAGAANLYQIGGAPLIDRDLARPVLAAFLDGCGTGDVPARWIFQHVDLSAGFATLCARTGELRGLAVIETGTYKRPRLTRMADGFDHHMEAVIGKKRVRSIQRSLRRLSELGTVEFEHASDPALVRARIEAFLALEHSGWKGHRSTSFRSRRDHERFARLAFGGSAEAEGLASVDSLLLDGEPIAISINLQAGRVAFTPKCTFDERYRRYGPGVVLEYLVIERFYNTDSCTAMDASTTTGDHLISRLWNETRPLGALVVGPKGWQTSLLASVEDGRCRAKRRLKSLLRRRPTAR